MERYTPHQVKRAQAQEQLLLRLKQGEDFDTLCQELDLSHSRDYIWELRRRYREGGSSWEALIDHRHGHASKMTPERRAWVKKLKQENLALTQQEIADRFEAEFGLSISQGRIGQVLHEEDVAIPGGLLYRSQEEPGLPMERAGSFFPSGGSRADGSVEHGDPGSPGADRDLPGA